MSDPAAAAAFVFIVGLLVCIFLVGLLVHAARDYAEDKRREQRYAAEWKRTHQINQKVGRFGYDTTRYHHDQPERPE